MRIFPGSLATRWLNSLNQMLFVGAMQPGQSFIYEESEYYRQHRPLSEPYDSGGRAMLPVAIRLSTDEF